jgi:hypothetical protein
MTAITYRRPVTPVEVVMRTANGILLRVPTHTVRGPDERTPDTGRKVRKLVQALVAYKQAKRK